MKKILLIISVLFLLVITMCGSFELAEEYIKYKEKNGEEDEE